jgi:hypothetical protein
VSLYGPENLWGEDWFPAHEPEISTSMGSCFPQSPNTSTKKSEAPLITLGSARAGADDAADAGYDPLPLMAR